MITNNPSWYHGSCCSGYPNCGHKPMKPEGQQSNLEMAEYMKYHSTIHFIKNVLDSKDQQLAEVKAENERLKVEAANAKEVLRQFVMKP